MEHITKKNEISVTEALRQQYVDGKKRLNQENQTNTSKTAQKKIEKNLISQWSATNPANSSSLSIDNAIMYMQNVLSVIEHKI